MREEKKGDLIGCETVTNFPQNFLSFAIPAVVSAATAKTKAGFFPNLQVP